MSAFQLPVRSYEEIAPAVFCVGTLQLVLEIRLDGKKRILQVGMIQWLNIHVIPNLKDPVTKKAQRDIVVTEDAGCIGNALDGNNTF
ncbi:MAG: hypothetical protein II835_05335 [Fibrobacter sp.]|nr:hypothetical protein [Fibrobacter sp.]